MDELRVAEPEDAAAIAALSVAAWRWAYRGILPDAYLASLSVESRERMWATVLASEESSQRVLVWDDGVVRGYVSYGQAREERGAQADDVGEIYALYVEEGRARQGLGGTLHDGALEAMREAGFVRVIVWVLEANARGRAFYARHGWAPDGPSKKHPFGDVERVEIRLARAL